MAGSAEQEQKKTEDSEDESEILEESPCGRWLKRREEVCHFHWITKFFNIFSRYSFLIARNEIQLQSTLNNSKLSWELLSSI